MTLPKRFGIALPGKNNGPGGNISGQISAKGVKTTSLAKSLLNATEIYVPDDKDQRDHLSP